MNSIRADSKWKFTWHQKPWPWWIPNKDVQVCTMGARHSKCLGAALVMHEQYVYALKLYAREPVITLGSPQITASHIAEIYILY